ncbi:MAG TPA: exopolysaccharide biosynthesis polyprenyl glycosylphosphotransferase [Solirubrobacteraceae bacterium]|jgi:exopolysaccharide biosynthesis polyprenyl glycosylphosphotransferase|nr:exopolysaccharide biosynthesis polyprenyl glycosylphosphotransferase [Solirubrobacteraceae bacterium]
MAPTNITQQTSTAVPLQAELTRAAPQPTPLQRRILAGRLQWALEGQGSSVLRPALDFVLVSAAVTIALGGISGVLHPDATAAPLLATPPLVMILFYLRGLYRTRLRALVLDGLVPVLSGISVAAMAVAMIGIYANGKIPDHFVRTWLFAVGTVACGRALLTLAQRWARARRLVGKPVLIMGAGVVGAQVARRLEAHPEYGLVPVGFLDEDPRSIAEVGGRDVPVLGTVEDLDEAVQSTGVRNLIVAFSSVADERVSRLIQRCQELGVEVSVVPRMFDTINNRVGYDTVGGLPLMSFTSINPRGLQFAIKHGLDRVFALTFLVLLSPVLLGVALAVRLSSSGPVLFRQRRVGRDGKAFDLFKFRSMRLCPGETMDEEEETSSLEFLLPGDTAPGGVEGDDRRTLIGRFLRRTSIDELPQLFNVLKGEMSLIGPRPERPEFVELFTHDITRYGDRHRVKSGITGWAQVHGLRGQTSLAERVEWDNYYIAHWSLGLDMKILALTLAALFHNAE